MNNEATKAPGYHRIRNAVTQRRGRAFARITVLAAATVTAWLGGPRDNLAFAQSTFFYGGGSRTWSNAQSWWSSYLATTQTQALTAPTPTATAIFNTSGSNAAGTVNFIGDASIRGLRILQPATGGLTLRGADATPRTLTIGAGGIVAEWGNTGNLTLGGASNPLNINLGQSQSWRLGVGTFTAANTLTISNTVAGSAAAGTSQTLLIERIANLDASTGVFSDGTGGGRLNLWISQSQNGANPAIRLPASPSTIFTGTLTLQSSGSGFGAMALNGMSTSGTYASISQFQMAGTTLLAGPFRFSGTNTINMLGGSTFSGTMTNSGTFIRSPGGGILVAANNTITGASAQLLNGSVLPWVTTNNDNMFFTISGGTVTYGAYTQPGLNGLPLAGSAEGGAYRIGPATLNANRVAGAIWFENGSSAAATLQLDGYSLATNAISPSMPMTITSNQSSGFLGIGSSGELILQVGSSFTIDASVRETGASAGWLTIGTKNYTGGVGVNSVTLSGSNSHRGGTSILSRGLNINNPFALGSGTFRIGGNLILLDNTTAAPLTVATNNYNEWNSDFAFGGTQDLNLGTGTVSLGTWAGTVRTVTVNAGNLTVGGRIVDGSYSDLPTTGLAKDGPGTLILSGSNGYTGVTEAWGGELRFANRNALYGADTTKWTAANLVTGTGGILSVSVGNQAGAFTTADLDILDGAVGGPNGGYLGIDTSGVASGTFTYGTNLANPSNGNILGIAKTGSGTLVLSGTNTFTGGVLVRQGALRVTATNQIGTGTATVAGGLLDMTGLNVTNMFSLQSGTIANTTISGSSLTANVTGPAVISGTLTGAGAAGNLTKSGTGTLVLSAANTYSGTTTLSGGLLSIAADNNLGSTAQLVFNGGGLQVTGTALANLSTRTFTYTSGSTVTFDIADPANSFTVTQVLGQGAGGLTKSGPGTLVLNGANTFTGLTTITGGTVKLTNAAGLGTNASTLTITGGVLDLTGYSPTKGTTTFSGGLVTGGTLTSSANYAATSGTVATGLAGTVGLTKSGTGVFVLSGSNMYTGVTTASASGGILQFATKNSLYGGGTSSWTKANIVVNSAATLAVNVGGTGEFQPADVTTLLTGIGGTVASNGLLAGSSVGFDTTNSGTAFTVSDVIANTTSGSVGLVKLGTGTLILSASNTFTGVTAVGFAGGPTSGVLQLASTGFVSPTVTIFGGTFDTAGQNRSITTLTLGGGGAGSSASLQTGSGTATLAGNVTFTETNNPAGATIGGNLSLGGAARTFTVNDSTAANADLTIAAVINQGGTTAFGLTKSGFGTLALTGQNTFAGKVLVNQGTVQIDSINSSGASPLGTNTTTDLGSGMQPGTLRWVGATSGTTNRTFNLAGLGAGATIDASGVGALVITSTVTATGGGMQTLTLGGTGTAANTIGAIINGSGTTSVVKDGPGLWRINAASTYSGAFTVRNGTLVAAVDSLANSNGAFGGSTGPVDVLIGDISPTATGTAALLLAAGINTGKVMNVQGVGGSQAVVLGGEGGAVDFQGSVYLGRPVTLVAGAGGTTSFSGFFYGPTGSPSVPAVNITVGSAVNTGVVSVRDLKTSGTVGVQFGTLRLAPPVKDAIGPTTPVWIGSATAGARLDLNGNVQTLANLSFTGVGGTLADLAGGGGLVLANAGSPAAVGVTGTGHVISTPVALDDAATFTVAGQGRLAVGGVIADGATLGRGLTKAGGGTLVLTNANTYTGTTNVLAGTLRIGDGGTSGSLNAAGVLALGGGSVILDRSDNFTQAFAGTVVSGNPSFAMNAGNALNFGSLTTLPGAVLDIPTTGTFITSSANVNGILAGGITYGGTTWAVANGPAAIGGLTAFTLTGTAGNDPAAYGNANIDVNSSPSLSGAIAANSLRFASAAPTTLTLSGSNTLAGGILVTPGVGANPSAITGGTLVASGGPLMVMQSNAAAALTIGAVLANGTAATGLVKSGPGTLVLAAANTYTGTTTFDGTLQLGGGGTAGSIAGPLVGSAGSTLAFNRSNAVVQGTDFPNTISGAINVSQIGSGTLTLNGANTYTGTTSVNAGTLVVGNGATAGSIASSAAITGASGGTLAFNRSGAVVQGTDFASPITGGLGLTQAGSGTLTLSGTNTFSGPTRAAAGRINVSTALAIQNSTLDMNAADSGTVAFAQNSTVGGLSGSRNLDLGGVTLSVGNNGTNTTYSGGLSGGALTKVGAGMLALTGSNTYAGVTTVSGGTLAIGDGGTTGSIAGNVTNSAALAFNRSDSFTFAGVISGTGSLVKQGAGTLTLTGLNTFTGPTTVAGGLLVVPAFAPIASQSVVNLDGGTLSVAQPTMGSSMVLNGGTLRSAVVGGVANQGTITGGTTNVSGGYVTHTFTTTGTATLSMAMPGTAQVLVVGGGGGGGGSIGGGGGGGGVVYLPSAALSGSYTVTVGAGGGGGSGSGKGVSGTASTFSNAATSVVAAGGGGGGFYTTPQNTTPVGVDGGSGGGAGATQIGSANGGSATGSSLGTFSGTIYGSRGGNVTTARNVDATVARGGGGAGVTDPTTLDGVATPAVATAGSGGVGIQINIGGTNLYWGGGGGGGAYFSNASLTSGGNGGLGGGGGGASGSATSGGTQGSGGGSAWTSGSAATTVGGGGGANTGGGGGGGFWNNGNGVGGAGGSGIVIVSYPAVYQTPILTLTGSIQVASTSTLDDAGGGIVVQSTMTGLGGITKTGTGTLTLSASNSFSGTTTVSAGSLLLGDAQGLGRSTFAGGAGAVSFGGLSAATFGGLAGSSALALSNTAAAAVALTVGANDQNSTYSGILSGNGSLSKIGLGMLSLSGSNTFSGPTTVTTGTLAVDGRLASAVTVQAAGVLGGSGRVASSLTGAGLVAPGNSPGILTADSFDPTGGLDLAFEFTGAAPLYTTATSSINDILRLTGTAPFAAALSPSINTVSLYLPASAAKGGVYQGGFFSDLNSTSFANFATWATNGNLVAYYQSTSGTITYNGMSYSLLSDIGGASVTPSTTTVASAGFSDGTVTNGQVTTFTVVVPEPGSLALAALGLGLAGGALLRRRRGL